MSLIALALIAAVVLDAGGRADQCSSANALLGAREYQPARAAFTRVLEDQSGSACAQAGLRRATKGQCVRAERLASSGDAKDAQAALIALAGASPPPGPRSCVWSQLTRLSQTSTTTQTPPS